MKYEEMMECIKCEMKDKEISQRKIARATGIDYRAVNRWLKLHNVPKMTDFIDICESVGMGIRMVNNSDI